MEIHRCRFVDFPAYGISALAFSHSSNQTSSTPLDLRLAVGREKSGDIEVWNPVGGKWRHETTIQGANCRFVEQLAWTQDLEAEEREDTTVYKPGRSRLFSIGGGTGITEWDLDLKQSKRVAEGNFGDIWCFAAQPQVDLNTKYDDAPPSQDLVAGCSDGNIILFSTAEGDLRYSRTLLAGSGRKTKVLSITWRDRNTVIAGYEDSSIRVIDVPNRRTIRNMTLGKSSEGAKSVVWTVKCLPNGTILSGDSAGELKVWDAKNLSLVQKLHTHQSDILDLAFNTKGDRIWTVGVDRRTVVYRLVSVPGVKTKRWVETSHRRFHKSDVKAVATYESSDMSVLVSGGLDASLIANSMQDDADSRHHRLSHLPQQLPVCSARRSRLCISWWQRNLHIYHIPKRNAVGISLESSDYSLLATLQVAGDHHIRHASISEDARFIFIGTESGARLFQIRLTTTSGRMHLKSRSIGLPTSLSKFGARLLGISPDSKWIYAIRPDNTIVLAKLALSQTAKDRPEVHKSITKLVSPSTEASPVLGTYPATITTAAFSHDSRVLAVGTLLGNVTTWVLIGHEDGTPLSGPASPASRIGSDFDAANESDSDDDDPSVTPTVHNQRWTLTPPRSSTPYPSLSSPVLFLTFRPLPTTLQPPHSPSQPEGNIGLHATRHTPHPISREHPEPPQLIAVTADNKLIEFDVYSGRVTEWSKRNPHVLHKGLGKISDHVKGGYWDTTVEGTESQQRLWLYGSMFLFMMDLAQDIAQDDPRGKKRRWRDTENDQAPGNDVEKQSDASKKRTSFLTLEYRDILGAGVIGQGDEGKLDSDKEEKYENGDEDVDMQDVDESVADSLKSTKRQLEVVIVERPLWDLQLKQLEDGQDWES